MEEKFSDLYTEVTMQNKKLQDEKAELLNQLKQQKDQEVKKVEVAAAAKAAEKAKEEKEKDVPKKVEPEEKKDESQIV